ncbi:protein NCBP2AS2 homolog [Condylostylus longicornis]|uniref:protein NCBP2AS2 homolog n=1 Tax=Condylostylus longicornis TaxID=2530218 RepID=UPI00244E1A5F|nr:protein NCBP2AS2 homolog [Condylostylus longicornis]
MVLRLIFRYLANNEQLVQKLSESYLVRRAAQLTISLFYKSKNFAETYKVDELSPKRFKSFVESFKTNIKQEIDGAKEQLKKRK